MLIDILTGFPEMFPGLINSSILRNALLEDATDLWVHNLRHFTRDRHGNIDDTPYGGGAGMVLMAEPVWNAVDVLKATRKKTPVLMYMTPQGEPLTQKRVREIGEFEWLIILCGHYKDVDARVFERDPWLEISVGDFVLSGGELPAACLVDALTRLIPGVINDMASADSDSFEDGLLDTPFYTKPEEIQGLRVPDVLISGHHANIEKWRIAQRTSRTQTRRPDLWRSFEEKQKSEK
jgi:tRNA (guanine37-N1)-methyltransferase